MLRTDFILTKQGKPSHEGTIDCLTWTCQVSSWASYNQAILRVILTAADIIPDATWRRQPAWIRPVLQWCLSGVLRWHFHAVRVLGVAPVIAPGQRILFIANHASRWDSFLLQSLQGVLAPQLPHYQALLEREYQRSILFQLLDCLPITPADSSSARFFLWRLRELKREHELTGFTLAFFPQGCIKPSFARPLDFKKGIKGISVELAPLTLIPVGIHIEAMAHRKPEALLSLGKPLQVEFGEIEIEAMEAAVIRTLDDLFTLLNQYGENLFNRELGLPYFELITPRVDSRSISWSPG